jgi:hypothetical protein
MRSLAIIVVGAAALAGCTAVPAERPGRPAVNHCRAEAGQRFVGQHATGETGAAIRAATGAARLRWVPPRTAVTLEFAYDRVTVSYGDDYVITKVSCN